MGLPDVSQAPKKDSMGMDYIPVYEGEEPEDGSTVKVSLEKVQRLGVVTAPAQSRDRFMRTINAVGTVALDERRMAAVTTKVEGWVERLHLNTTGQAVRRGAPILEDLQSGSAAGTARVPGGHSSPPSRQGSQCSR
jgi:Cu(I)/Ag(I) efflux system membrane fusion protein